LSWKLAIIIDGKTTFSLHFYEQNEVFERIILKRRKKQAQTNQSTNQTTKQPTNQPINQPPPPKKIK
jgi:hypothetical protein